MINIYKFRLFSKFVLWDRCCFSNALFSTLWTDYWRSWRWSKFSNVATGGDTNFLELFANVALYSETKAFTSTFVTGELFEARLIPFTISEDGIVVGTQFLYITVQQNELVLNILLMTLIFLWGSCFTSRWCGLWRSNLQLHCHSVGWGYQFIRQSLGVNVFFLSEPQIFPSRCWWQWDQNCKALCGSDRILCRPRIRYC